MVFVMAGLHLVIPGRIALLVGPISSSPEVSSSVNLGNCLFLTTHEPGKWQKTGRTASPAPWVWHFADRTASPELVGWHTADRTATHSGLDAHNPDRTATLGNRNGHPPDQTCSPGGRGRRSERPTPPRMGAQPHWPIANPARRCLTAPMNPAVSTPPPVRSHRRPRSIPG